MNATDSAAFRFAGLWQWNPVSCVTPRSYDEKHMMAHNDWFFDRSFMARYFDALREAGLNTWVLANTHPFPFMVDLAAFPEAQVLGPAERQRYQVHYHWLFETARAKGLQPFVLFHTCYVPDRFGERHQIRPTNATPYTPSPLAIEYTRHCVRLLCDTYPELAGINGEASENVAVGSRASFVRDAIVAGVHDSRQRPLLFVRGWVSDPAEMKAAVLDPYEGECFFTVKYTWEFLVHRKPDPEFMRWIDTCGAARVLPEFWISNYQPFGCHDTTLAAGIREEVRRLGCPGFTSHPMDLYGAPFVQPAARGILQIERDQDWFATLSGLWEQGGPERADGFGLPDADMAAHAAQAACAPFQRIMLFLTGNKQNFLQPQFLAAIGGSPDRKAGLQTLFHWGNLPHMTDSTYGRWIPPFEGTPVFYPAETGEGYRLETLLDELERMESAWCEPPPTASRRAEVYQAWRRDVQVLHLMARAWAHRAEAILAHYAGRTADVAAGLERSLACVRRAAEILPAGDPCRLLVGRFAIILTWQDLVGALERELADGRAGTFANYYFFGAAESYVVGGRDFAERPAAATVAGVSTPSATANA